jgi:hypothetical protein
MGGQTVFPLMDKAITPVRGSALLWFNYLRNGKVDKRMTRGECPVLMGHKWGMYLCLYMDVVHYRLTSRGWSRNITITIIKWV